MNYWHLFLLRSHWGVSHLKIILGQENEQLNQTVVNAHNSLNRTDQLHLGKLAEQGRGFYSTALKKCW